MSVTSRHVDRSGGSFAISMVLTMIFAVVAYPAHADTFTPEADSYVEASAPTTNYGTRTTLRTDGSPIVRSYLRFNVQGVSGVSSATLKVFANSSNSTGIDARKVDSNGWGETTLTYANAPAFGPVLDSSGPITGGNWYEFDVTAALSAAGQVSFALTSTSTTATSLASRESSNRPQLLVQAEGPPPPPPPPAPSTFLVSRLGDTYQAASAPAGAVYSGALKFVVESAVRDLKLAGGGDVIFAAQVFDFGSEYGLFQNISDIGFAGQGMDATVIQNFSSASADTEPFNIHDGDRVVIRDLTVVAGGTARSTSDAIDFDRGNDILIERVRITASRGRGIVFDGKDVGGAANRNVIRDCVITGAFGDGIELLASSQNRIEACTIANVGGHGIQINKSSSQAGQPNKKSNDNVLLGNVIDQAGQDGINVSSSDRNIVDGNIVTNSSDDVSGRDGIRIASFDGVTCNDNVVRNSRATDNQATKTQTYGLHIASAGCNRTVVGPNNDFNGNRVAPIRNRGTNTQFV